MVEHRGQVKASVLSDVFTSVCCESVEHQQTETARDKQWRCSWEHKIVQNLNMNQRAMSVQVLEEYHFIISTNVKSIWQKQLYLLLKKKKTLRNESEISQTDKERF